MQKLSIVVEVTNTNMGNAILKSFIDHGVKILNAEFITPVDLSAIATPQGAKTQATQAETPAVTNSKPVNGHLEQPNSRSEQTPSGQTEASTGQAGVVKNEASTQTAPSTASSSGNSDSQAVLESKFGTEEPLIGTGKSVVKGRPVPEYKASELYKIEEGKQIINKMYDIGKNAIQTTDETSPVYGVTLVRLYWFERAMIANGDLSAHTELFLQKALK